jgi:PhnB protein
MNWKPDGYPDLSPYLLVADVDAALDFAAAAFGASRLRVERDAENNAIHGEARIGDSVAMFGRSPDSPPGHIHLYVPDVQATYDAALAAGATSVQPPQAKGDGDLRAGVQDPQGTFWWPSTQLPLE